MEREKKPKIIRCKLKDKIITDIWIFFETEKEKEKQKKRRVMKKNHSGQNNQKYQGTFCTRRRLL